MTTGCDRVICDSDANVCGVTPERSLTFSETACSAGNRTAGPARRRNRDHRRASGSTIAAAKAGDTEAGIRTRGCPQIRFRSPAPPVRQHHRQPALPGAARSHSPPPADPGASGRSNSASRRPDAPRGALRHLVRMPPPQSPASARRSTGDAARDRSAPLRLPSHPSLAPVQTPVFAPQCHHATSDRLTKDGLPRRGTIDEHLTDEIARRRTFAIISHPDASKTSFSNCK